MNIQQYAGLAASILLFKHEAEAQIVYTDIPDITIYGEHSHFFIDLNNDGIYDVKLAIKRTDSYTASLYCYYHIKRYHLYSKPEPGNGILDYGGNKVAALQLNDLINSNSPWLTNDKFEMGYAQREICNCTPGTSYDTSWTFSQGPWLAGVGDRYLGIRFDASGETFYGWARIGIENPLNIVTIKDYAYQATPDSAIAAGQNFATAITSIPEGSIIVNSLPEQTVQVILVGNDYLGGKVTVTNLLGQSVAIFNADNLITNHSLNNGSPGKYNVSIYKDGKQFNKTVILY